MFALLDIIVPRYIPDVPVLNASPLYKSERSIIFKSQRSLQNMMYASAAYRVS